MANSPTQAPLPSNKSLKQGCRKEEDERADKKLSPSIKSTKFPFQITLLRATEFAQKLLIG